MSTAEKWPEFDDLPPLLTPEEVARVLRKTPKAIYTMKESGLLPGVYQLSPKRWLVRKAVLLKSLTPQGRSPAQNQEP